MPICSSAWWNASCCCPPERISPTGQPDLPCIARGPAVAREWRAARRPIPPRRAADLPHPASSCWSAERGVRAGAPRVRPARETSSQLNSSYEKKLQVKWDPLWEFSLQCPAASHLTSHQLLMSRPPLIQPRISK